MTETTIYQPKNKIRIVTAASLFDGHDAAINIMRRLLQASGAEVIHLGHNRSVKEVVDAAIQEDAQGIAVTSYQGGHVEYFKYMFDLLKAQGATIKIFGGGGGTIHPDEIAHLHQYGITRIYSPDDGRAMGLQGMINHLLQACDFATTAAANGELKRILGPGLKDREPKSLGRLISIAESGTPEVAKAAQLRSVPVLGITGTGGAGKSSLVDEFVRRFLLDFTDKTLAIISVDPSKRKSGGALLGDRIRMNAINCDRVYMRSLATRQAHRAVSAHVREAIGICTAAGFDLIIVETSGIGQSDTEVTEIADVSLYVMTGEYGAATQLEKIDMLDFADIVAINKFDKPGSLDALRDVRKQYKRNHKLFDLDDGQIPIYGTIASLFNDPGTNELYRQVVEVLIKKCGLDRSQWSSTFALDDALKRPDRHIIPPKHGRYLAEIVETIDSYREWARVQVALARQAYALWHSLCQIEAKSASPDDLLGSPLETETPAGCEIAKHYQGIVKQLDHRARDLLKSWSSMKERYAGDQFRFEVRGKTLEQPLSSESLSHLKIRRIALPQYHDWGDLLQWMLLENLPGEFPYTAGVFPLKRIGEDPARMFAGEGGPERTNSRFHYLSRGLEATRLSTAFDSVTLYGEDPDHRPDIYGKIGNSGVSVASVDDAKKLYSGFDLSDARTSVSMTINGPAPMVLGFFLNAAIDQQCEKHIKETKREAQVTEKITQIYRDCGVEHPRYQGELPAEHSRLGLDLLGVSGSDVLPQNEYEKIKAGTLKAVRGTVQADILKEDQAQNTCIFSTEFALRMMADTQQYFISEGVRNFYSVSISGYHIAEAGANPITQLAFTLANGFTFVEYYLARGMAIDDFAPNLSFFFSNGIDPEYAVIGRVARRIWATVIRDRYGGSERSQKLKYHIQTSGRSLHAQEIAFNDIRTTLQALYALYDNCNSLHTNAYDEAITTPTEESVRRALAIQLIINKELGLNKNENPLQGSFIIEELTDLVERAVLEEFGRINDRGGVLGAMERMYQRSKIQDESLYYESLKHSGELPIVGVNTFLNAEGSPTILPGEVIRSTAAEKEYAIQSRDAFQKRNESRADAALAALRQVALRNDNLFEELMETCKVATLGQISHALYEVGGQYRRNM